MKQALLVDDNPDYVHEDQTSQWLPVSNFGFPYSKDDRELEALAETIRIRLAAIRD